MKILVELHNRDTSKRKLIGCESTIKAEEFVKIFNLVASFSKYDDHIKASSESEKTQTKNDQKKIEKWVQNYVLSSGGETMKFESDINYLSVMESMNRFFRDDITAFHFSYNQLTDQGFQTSLQPLLQNFHLL